MISFNEIPSNLLIPFARVEYDSSKAQKGNGPLPYRALLLAQKLTTGTAVANTPYLVGGVNDVRALGGPGSMIQDKAVAWFANKPAVVETWIVCLDDNGAGVSATGTVTFTAVPTVTKTLYLYIGDIRFATVIPAGTATTAIPALVKATIDAYTDGDLPFTTSIATSVLTITYRHKGEVGNGLDIRVNKNAGEVLPDGLALTIVAMSGGTTNPTLTTAISNLGDEWFQIIAHPYSDATSLTAIETELASRGHSDRQIDGFAFCGVKGTFSALSALGAGRNSKFSQLTAQSGENPVTPPWKHGVMYAAQIASAGSADPARPFKGLGLVGCSPVATTDKFIASERNTLLVNGISTSMEVGGGQVAVEQCVTTYHTNSLGAPDTAYKSVNTGLCLMYFRWSFNNWWLTKYPRHKLADNGANIAPGQAVIDPAGGKDEAIAWFSDLESKGLVENSDLFAESLVVEKNGNTLQFLLPVDIMNQLISTAAKLQFTL